MNVLWIYESGKNAFHKADGDIMELEKNKKSLYSGRYPYLKYRQGVWREIVRFVRKDAENADVAVELGAGYL